ncbi:hypothetical protein PoB_001277800 [Plakobranchus ocellatus]|uniref:Uncharacterized protein n=1 Tax=Plakobranchus ocellatus TaxID=259542 RepID=A0AAV3YVK9_9GAST|nr:hypothetical protein PoB_001277800 [Plakobranchus ocellatus]
MISDFQVLRQAKAGGGARIRRRRVPADLRADSQATVPPKPPPNQPIHDKMISGFMAIGRPDDIDGSSNAQQRSPFRSHGGLANNCATNAPCVPRRHELVIRVMPGKVWTSLWLPAPATVIACVYLTSSPTLRETVTFSSLLYRLRNHQYYVTFRLQGVHKHVHVFSKVRMK